jgi:hypothetical protein
MTMIVSPQARIWSSTIFDAHASLPMEIWRILNSNLARPIVLVIDGCQWSLSADEAALLAKAARALRRAIEVAERDKVAPTPRALIRHALDTDVGKVLFEVAIVAESSHLCVTWADTCLYPPPIKRLEILYGLGDVMGEAAHIMRGEPAASHFGPDAMAGRPPGQVRSQRPGERWQTWQPQFWRPDGELGKW